MAMSSSLLRELGYNFGLPRRWRQFVLTRIWTQSRRARTRRLADKWCSAVHHRTAMSGWARMLRSITLFESPCLHARPCAISLGRTT